MQARCALSQVFPHLIRAPVEDGTEPGVTVRSKPQIIGSLFSLGGVDHSRL